MGVERRKAEEKFYPSNEKKLARVEKWCLCNMPIQIYNSAFWHPDLVINICA